MTAFVNSVMPISRESFQQALHDAGEAAHGGLGARGAGRYAPPRGPFRNRLMPRSAASSFQAADGGGADAARRGIDDAPQAHAVVRVIEHAQVGDDILNFFAREKFLARRRCDRECPGTSIICSNTRDWALMR